MDQRLKDLLSNLGRRTLRGVKPCPKCGTYNGTRGFSCKNKSCDVVFKAIDDRKKKTTEACRIHTDNPNSQVFSVRLRDKGPDYRDFVQLTAELVDNGDGHFSTVQNAECFVDSCSNGILSTAPAMTACQHIQATLNCHAESEILAIKSALIHSLNIPADFKDELWTVSTEDNQGLQAPVVQRVSKTVFVVKCTTASNKYPLGYLHCSLIETRNGKTGVLERKFVCPCRKLNHQNSKSSHDVNQQSKECVHFYACILAFISDEKYMNEFSYHIQASNVLAVSLDSIDELSERQLVVHFEVMPHQVDVPDDSHDLLCVDSLVLAGHHHHHHDATSNFATDDAVGINMSELLNGTLEVVATPPPANVQRGKIKIPALKKSKNPPATAAASAAEPELNRKHPADENSSSSSSPGSSLMFEHWLASVTERINQSMHYGMAGNADPLVYTIPHAFFELLRERMSRMSHGGAGSGGGKKKRLPNATEVFQRKDRPPFFATLTKYTWHLYNPVHVKYIFDTPLVQLELTRSFVENQDGTYDLFVPKNAAVESTGADICSALPTLKPLELRTYLMIGPNESNAEMSTPFTIEWIPDVLPQSKFGELTLHFQFGHQRHPSTAHHPSVRSDPLKRTSAAAAVAAAHPRRKKLKPALTTAVAAAVAVVNDQGAVGAKDLNNIELDFNGVAPLNDTEFQELTKSVP